MRIAILRMAFFSVNYFVIFRQALRTAADGVRPC
jgi:hypothetical protein